MKGPIFWVEWANGVMDQTVLNLIKDEARVEHRGTAVQPGKLYLTIE